MNINEGKNITRPDWTLCSGCGGGGFSDKLAFSTFDLN